MRANSLPALQGLAWLRSGYALWRGAMLPLTANAMTMVMCVLLGALVPLIGMALAVLLMLTFNVGMFVSCDYAARRRAIPPALLFRNFGANFRRLAWLAALTVVIDTLCLGLALLITDVPLSTLAAASLGSEQSAKTALMQMLPAAGLMLILRIPVIMATWFAPPLMALLGLGLGKALFFSLVAFWRNLGAMLVFLIGYGLICLAVSLVLSLLLQFAPYLGSLVSAPCLMVLAPVYYAGFYVSARDIFGEWPET